MGGEKTTKVSFTSLPFVCVQTTFIVSDDRPNTSSIAGCVRGNQLNALEVCGENGFAKCKRPKMYSNRNVYR